MVEAERLEQEAKRVNDANQAAILRLMNELQTVAEGDLTQQATVTEDITGAIADSVNYTVEELRSLVARCRTRPTGDRDDRRRWTTTSTELLAASDEQLREIRETGDAVLQMAGRINEVSAQAQQSAQVARQSLRRRDRPDRGAERHRRHERHPRPDPGNLQAHQAAGRVLAGDRRDHRADLRHHRADQRAGAQRRHPGRQSAGEAGRGFSWWPRKCSAWPNARPTPRGRSRRCVKTIQTDTQDAVAAMARSTQGVVEVAP
jgi:twitching motility protein PilJ